MKPNTVNITNPAKKLVKQSTIGTINASLKYNSKQYCRGCCSKDRQCNGQKKKDKRPRKWSTKNYIKTVNRDCAPGCVKPKTVKLVHTTSPLRTEH
jgi:hypothetical protein